MKSLASQAQVISLTDRRVQLRLGVQSLLTEHNKKLLEERISLWLDRTFRVEFLSGEVEAGSTVADAERRKKEAERRELIEKFKSDPVVKEIVRLFNGKIDEDSIRPLTPEEMAEKD